MRRSYRNRFPASHRGWTEFDYETEDSYYCFDVEYVVTEGEPMVMYTRNGDGYPGSPPACEFISARCTCVADEFECADSRHDEKVAAKQPHASDRQLSKGEADAIGKWFLEQIEADDELRQRVERACFSAATDDCVDDRW